MTDEQIARVMHDHNVSETVAAHVVSAVAKLEERKAAMADKRALLYRISIEEADIDEDYADSGSLSEDEERALSDWPR